MGGGPRAGSSRGANSTSSHPADGQMWLFRLIDRYRALICCFDHPPIGLLAMAIQRRWDHAKAPGDLRDRNFRIAQHGCCRREILGGEGRGLPPLRPRVRAASRPATVRSRMIERSNSARAAKMWKMSLPPLVVGRRKRAKSSFTVSDIR